MLALLGAAATVAGLAGLALAARSRPTVSAATTVLASFRSASLRGDLHVLVRLPAGYATSGERYPVVYFLHGLPAGSTSYASLGWLVAAFDRSGGRAILVIPQASREANGDPEYLDWGPGRNWATAIGNELPRFIDGRYRTIATRTGRALVGVSAGGYGAASIGLARPGEFSVVESWSGYFEPTDPTGAVPLDLGSTARNAEASVHAQVRTLAAQFRRHPTYLAFYVGSGDPTFVGENVLLDEELREAGVPHTYATYPGGHSVALWRREASTWFAAALDHLAPPAAA